MTGEIKKNGNKNKQYVNFEQSLEYENAKMNR